MENREIKFRAWDISDKDKGAYMLGPYNLTDSIFNNKDIRLMILMQYTGLKDENGKEIYEGDIVNGRYLVQRSLDPNAEPEIVHFEGVIEYAEGCYYVKAENGQCVFSFTYSDYEMEAIGNIYENPELA